MTNRLVVIRLTNTDLDGRWIEVDHVPIKAATWNAGQIATVTMVTTGSVEWRDDGAAAEVYVPEHMLDIWRTEHDPAISDT